MLRANQITFANAWKPFWIAEKGSPVRPLQGAGGVEDRLRLVAFAELQARDAFLWGAERFAGVAPDSWILAWQRFAEVEERHAEMLLSRFAALGGDFGGRALSDKLSRLCRAAEEPVLFLFLLSSAEERGMEAGFTLGKQMLEVDSTSAEIFRQIAEEEVEHVNMANEALRPYNFETLKEQAKRVNARVSQ